MLNNDNEESRKMVEQCYRQSKTVINPIIDWTDEDVWEFIREYNVPYCKLYDQGHKRLGCIGCPMGSVERRQAEFKQYPKYEKAYIRAFEKMISERIGGGIARNSRPEKKSSDGTSEFENMTAAEIMQWWIN